MKDKRDEDASLSLHQIIDFAPAPGQLVLLAGLFPTQPFHYTAALGSGREARYVRDQGRGLGI